MRTMCSHTVLRRYSTSGGHIAHNVIRGLFLKGNLPQGTEYCSGRNSPCSHAYFSRSRPYQTYSKTWKILRTRLSTSFRFTPLHSRVHRPTHRQPYWSTEERASSCTWSPTSVWPESARRWRLRHRRRSPSPHFQASCGQLLPGTLTIRNELVICRGARGTGRFC